MLISFHFCGFLGGGDVSKRTKPSRLCMELPRKCRVWSLLPTSGRSPRAAFDGHYS